MNAAAPDQHPKKNPAKLAGTGGAFQQTLEGMEPKQSKQHFSKLDPDLTSFARILLAHPEGIRCADGRLVGCTHLPNKAKALRDHHDIEVETLHIPARTPEKPRGWYGRYRVTGEAKVQLAELLSGV